MTDHIDAPKLSLPVAPPKVSTLNMLHTSSLASIPSSSDGQELQSPNLRTRLDLAIRQARAATSRVEKREWEEEAQSILERLVDADAVCDCGIPYNLSTGRCDECDENERIMSALRATAGDMSRDVDQAIGF